MRGNGNGKGVKDAGHGDDTSEEEARVIDAVHVQRLRTVNYVSVDTYVCVCIYVYIYTYKGIEIGIEIDFSVSK